MTAIDPVPLGVAGLVSLALEQYVACMGHPPDPATLLFDDQQRLAYLARRLADAIDRPLTSPGSHVVARQVLDYFVGVDLFPHFATKSLEALRDGKRHDRLLISPRRPALALSFVAWSGTHREVHADRIGHYFAELVAPGKLLAERGIRVTGLLQIDAYLRDNADSEQPALSLDELFEVDLEYSYVPGFLLENPDEDGPIPRKLLLNPDLCSPAELQVLRMFMDR